MPSLSGDFDKTVSKMGPIDKVLARSYLSAKPARPLASCGLHALESTKSAAISD
jgi:hypothetical protein